MAKHLILYCFMAMFVFAIKAQENPGQNWSFEGYIESDNIAYKKEVSNLINSRRQIASFLKVKKTDENRSFVTSVEIREDFADKARNRFFLKEALFVKNFSSSDLIVGKQLLHWGTVDALNPTNIINPVDYSDLLDTDDERIGVMAINYKYYYNDWNFQAIAYVFEPSVMPQSNSRWAINPPAFVPNGAGGLMKANYYFVENKPGYTLENTQTAFKVARSFLGCDISLSYLKGNYNLPEISTKAAPVNTDSVNITLTQNYVKQNVVGADFATSVGKLGLRFETAFKIPEKNSKYKDPYVQYALGLDRSFNIGELSSFTIISQWIDGLTLKGSRYSTFELEHLFQKTIMLRAEAVLQNKLKMAVSSFALLADKAYYVQPKLDYTMADGIEFSFLLDLIGGAKGSLFNEFKNNNRAQLRLKYYF